MLLDSRGDMEGSRGGMEGSRRRVEGVRRGRGALEVTRRGRAPLNSRRDVESRGRTSTERRGLWWYIFLQHLLCPQMACNKNIL